MTATLDPELDFRSDRPESTRSGRIGRIVSFTILSGVSLAVVAVVGPFAGAEEHVITGTVLLSFAASWAALAHLSRRRTNQPQNWAKAPAAAMAVAAAAILVLEPTGNEARWVWPPAVLTLVVWMMVQSRRHMQSRARLFVLYPVFAALALCAIGGAYETYREATDTATQAMPGRLVDVGGHMLHIDCTGTGGPTVVLEGGLGEPSTMMASWVAPDVAATTRVCVYDRAGRGWSESAEGPQDGIATATDLHVLLERAGEPGPYVLAGHSAGGLYVLNFANLFPHDIAGVVLLDSMHPRQYERVPSWSGFYEMFRRASAIMAPLSRLGVMRIVNDTQFDNLPSPQREQERAFLSTPRHNRSVRDEFHMIRIAMSQADAVQTLGEVPLIVVTAERGQDAGWFEAQDDLMGLSVNSAHRFLPDATHAMVVGDEATARQSSDAILDLVTAIRNDTPINANTPPTPSTTATTAPAVVRPTTDVDQMVRIDNGRMHIRCTGTGDTTVVLIAGWDAGDGTWDATEPALSQHARVCSYAKLGTGNSDAPSTTQTFATQADDLHALLMAADEPGPYVVLGHSFGGSVAVTFASQHPDEVTGLMLLDASPTTWPATVCSVPAYTPACDLMHDPDADAERLDVFHAFDEVARITTLGDLPMTIMTAAHRDGAGLSAEELTRLDSLWADGQQHWSSLSSRSSIVTVEQTGHHIEVDHPQRVADELLKLVP